MSTVSEAGWEVVSPINKHLKIVTHCGGVKIKSNMMICCLCKNLVFIPCILMVYILLSDYPQACPPQDCIHDV